jgi:hypothetical protein
MPWLRVLTALVHIGVQVAPEHVLSKVNAAGQIRHHVLGRRIGELRPQGTGSRAIGLAGDLEDLVFDQSRSRFVVL